MAERVKERAAQRCGEKKNKVIMKTDYRKKMQDILTALFMLFIVGFIAWSLTAGCALSKTF
jgi:hypothetical protein